MRRYLLDTSPLAAFMLGRRRAVEAIGPWIANKEVLTSIIVYGEVEEHIKPMANYLALHGTLIRQLDDIKPLAITRQIMGLYADIRLQCGLRVESEYYPTRIPSSLLRPCATILPW